jgi:glutamine synthetase
LKVLAELEYYVIANQQNAMLFLGAPDRNYHECAPFAKFEDLRNEVLAVLNIAGIPTKYGHSEVGRILGSDNTLMEQHEIEFTSQGLAEMAETIAVAKWIIRPCWKRNAYSYVRVERWEKCCCEPERNFEQ